MDYLTGASADLIRVDSLFLSAGVRVRGRGVNEIVTKYSSVKLMRSFPLGPDHIPHVRVRTQSLTRAVGMGGLRKESHFVFLADP